jgi:hypothetical protein
LLITTPLDAGVEIVPAQQNARASYKGFAKHRIAVGRGTGNGLASENRVYADTVYRWLTDPSRRRRDRRDARGGA